MKKIKEKEVKNHPKKYRLFALFLITLILLSTIFIYMSYIKINSEIKNLKLDTIELNNKINELSTNLLHTKETVSTINDSMDYEIQLLKNSAGEDFSDVAEKGIASTVAIKTETGQGTGFIISDLGYIVTNAHVLVEAKKIQTIDSNKKIDDVSLVGYNQDMDIALLKINKTVNALELEPSENIITGEKVIAIGNPLGLQFSLSEGIVSGKNREGANGIKGYIQTDAALNPGNSGGPLINKKGLVIGINNFKLRTAENIGFALESDYIKYAVNEITKEKYGMILLP
jgi:S1-C subfamily serine protease